MCTLRYYHCNLNMKIKFMKLLLCTIIYTIYYHIVVEILHPIIFQNLKNGTENNSLKKCLFICRNDLIVLSYSCTYLLPILLCKSFSSFNLSPILTSHFCPLPLVPCLFSLACFIEL